MGDESLLTCARPRARMAREALTMTSTVPPRPRLRPAHSVLRAGRPCCPSCLEKTTEVAPREGGSSPREGEFSGCPRCPGTTVEADAGTVNRCCCLPMPAPPTTTTHLFHFPFFIIPTATCQCLPVYSTLNLIVPLFTVTFLAGLATHIHLLLFFHFLFSISNATLAIAKVNIKIASKRGFFARN